MAQSVIDQLNDQGFVILRKFLDRNVISAVRGALEKWVDTQARELMDAGRIDDPFDHEPFETRLAKLYESCLDHAPHSLRRQLHWPGMFGLFFHPGTLDLVESILGPEIRLYPNYTVRPKLPDHVATQVLWHQDAGYTESGQHGQDAASADMTVTQLRMVNAWAPLVPAHPNNGCMKFIPGTHHLGIVAHTQKNPYYLEIVDQALQPHLADAVDVITDPGDLVLFSNMLFHMGQPNCSQTVRWSCDWRYQDATQSTMRSHGGHIARSVTHPDRTVTTAEQWARLSFV